MKTLAVPAPTRALVSARSGTRSPPRARRPRRRALARRSRATSRREEPHHRAHRREVAVSAVPATVRNRTDTVRPLAADRRTRTGAATDPDRARDAAAGEPDNRDRVVVADGADRVGTADHQTSRSREAQSHRLRRLVETVAHDRDPQHSASHTDGEGHSDPAGGVVAAG